MKQHWLLDNFSWSVFFIYSYVAILFDIGGLSFLAFLIYWLGFVLGFAMVGLD